MISIFRLLGETFSRWHNHEGQRLGAALAFYTLLSGAPFAVFLLLVLSNFMSRQEVEDKMLDATRQMVGDTAARVVHGILTSTTKPHQGTVALVLALATLLFGASGAFMELREDLNKMWDAHEGGRGIIGLILRRVFSFTLVLAAGCVVLASMLTTAAVGVVGRYFSNEVPIPGWILGVTNFAASFAILSLVFLLIYRFVPDKRLPWRTLWTGAGFSALLFVIGKGLLTLYFSKAGVGSAYGAAGSIVAVALWIYYSAQIFLIGAEFTYLWETRRHPPPAFREKLRAA